MFQYQVDKIKETLHLLKNDYPKELLRLNDLPLTEKIELTYALKIINDIDNLLTHGILDLIKLSSDLQIYLQTNWRLISGTLLSYTACPDSPITQFLCELAKELVFYKNTVLTEGEKPISELELLFPGVCLESINNNYPNLCVVEHDGLNEAERLELAKLQEEIELGLIPQEPEQIIFNGSAEDKESEWYKKENYFELTPLRLTHPQLYQSRIERLQMTPELIQKIACFEKVLRYNYLLERTKSLINNTSSSQLDGFVIKGNYLIPQYTINFILNSHIQSHLQGALIPVSILLQPDDSPYRDKQMDGLVEKQEDLRQNLNRIAVQIEDMKEENSPFSLALLHKEQQEKAQVAHQLVLDIKEIYDEEKKRLINHSDYTTSYHEAQERLRLLKENKNSLLGHLTQLCTNLKHYDAHEGVGTQENAGAGVYESIRVFSEYYQTLGYHLVVSNVLAQQVAEYEVLVHLILDDKDLTNFEIHYKFIQDSEEHKGVLFTQDFPLLLTRIELLKQRNQLVLMQNKEAIPINNNRVLQELFSYQKELLSVIATRSVLNFDHEEKYKIPEELRNEIEFLLTLAENSDININATENIATCIGSRRELIEPLIAQHSVLLASISSSERYLATQIERTQQEVKQRACLLEEELKNKTYKGSDPLPITKRLLSSLNITLNIDSLTTLNGLMEFEPKEIKQLLEHEGRRKEVADLFPTLEGFYDFVFDHPSAKILALLEATGSVLLKKLCTQTLDCQYLLFGQTDEHFKVLAKSLILFVPQFDLKFFLAQHPEKKTLINEILSNKVDAVLAWSNNLIIWSINGNNYLSESLSHTLISKNCISHLRKFFHIDAKRKAVELILDGRESLIDAFNIEEELFGLAGADKNNKDAVIKAMLTNTLAYRFASKSLQNDEQIRAMAEIQNYRLRECICNCFYKQDDLDYITEQVRDCSGAFRHLSGKLRDNEKVLIAALYTDFSVINYASKRLKEDSHLQSISRILENELRVRACNCYLNRKKISFIKQQIEEDYRVFAYLPSTLRNNIGVILKALAQDSSTLVHALCPWSNDMLLIKISTITDPSLRRRACDCYLLRHNIEYIKSEVRSVPVLFNFLHLNLQKNIEVIMEGLGSSSEIMRYIPEPFRSDSYIQKIAAIANNKLRLSVCECYTNAKDTAFVLKQVKNNSDIFRYLTLELRGNFEIFMAALTQDKEAFHCTTQKNQNIPCIRQIATITNSNLRENACTCYLQQNNISFIIEAIGSNMELYPYLSKSLYDNPQIVGFALAFLPSALNSASERLQKNPSLRRIAHLTNDKERVAACSKFLKDLTGRNNPLSQFYMNRYLFMNHQRLVPLHEAKAREPNMNFQA